MESELIIPTFLCPDSQQRQVLGESLFQLLVSVSLSVHRGGEVMVEPWWQEHIAHITKGQETKRDQDQEVVEPPQPLVSLLLHPGSS